MKKREERAMPTLRELREAAGLTREQLATKIGNAVAASTVYRIETERVRPHPLVRAALAQAFGLAANQIDWPEERRQAGK